jgi:hypothetical protein
LHPALDDRVFDADEFGKTRFDHSSPLMFFRGAGQPANVF